METEEYGSKILAVGGVNRMTGKQGFAVARAIAAVANRRAVELTIKKGARLTLQVGRPPLINGQKTGPMRVGCGSATAGLFAPLFKKAADEVIVLDAHITSQLSRHASGRAMGMRPTGIRLIFSESTPGKIFRPERPGVGRHPDRKSPGGHCLGRSEQNSGWNQGLDHRNHWRAGCLFYLLC